MNILLSFLKKLCSKLKWLPDFQTAVLSLRQRFDLNIRKCSRRSMHYLRTNYSIYLTVSNKRTEPNLWACIALRVSNTLVIYAIYIVGLPTARQQNAIKMAFYWRADGDPLLYVYWVWCTDKLLLSVLSVCITIRTTINKFCIYYTIIDLCWGGHGAEVNMIKFTVQ